MGVLRIHSVLWIQQVLRIHITGNRDTIGGFGDTLGTIDTAGVEDGSRYCGHIIC